MIEDALPAGTVTFVFTDLEGSTRLLATLGDRYADLLGAHLGVVDREIGSHRGRLVSIDGDGTFSVFTTAPDAIAAVVEIQKGMARHQWPGAARVRVRIGVHTGRAVPGPGGYIGLDVHLAARVAAAAHGGQVVLTEATLRHVGGVPESVVDLGVHRLRDIPDPVRLHQISVEGLPSRFPPLRTIRGGVSTLPRPVGALFGREHDLQELLDLAARHRMLTLVGPGGTGKTRLAVELAGRMREAGEWVEFLDLTEVASEKDVVAGIAASLGLPEDPRLDRLSQVRGAIGDDRAAIVLDNCEHLDVADEVARLLSVVDGVSVLATSRAPVGVPGEHLYEVEPLPVAGATGPDAVDSPAVQLFVDRATAVSAGFRLTAASSGTVVEICRRLDGLPLAIELAASNVRVLGVEDIRDALGRRLDLLVAAGGFPSRHRSLQAALAGTLELLDQAALDAFDAFGVMAGPFHLDEAAAVIDCDRLAARVPIRTLVDHSLVVARQSEGTVTFRLLETMRWFALERLRAGGDEPEARRRHLSHFVGLALEMREGIRAGRAEELMARVRVLRPDILAALEHALATDVASAVDLVEGMVDAWALLGMPTEADHAIRRAIDAAGAAGDPSLELRALVALAETWHVAGYGFSPEVGLAQRIEARASEVGDPIAAARAEVWQAMRGDLVYERGVAAARWLEESGDYRGMVFALDAIAWMDYWGEFWGEARQVFARVHSAAHARGDVLGLLAATRGLIATSWESDQIAGAFSVLDDAQELATRVGVDWWEVDRLHWIASLSRRQGDLVGAARQLAEAHDLAASKGTLNQRSFIAAHEATIAWELQRLDVVVDKALEEVEMFGEEGTAFPLEMVAAVAVRRGSYEVAARLLGAAERWREPGGETDQGVPMPPWDLPRHQEVIGELEEALSPEVLGDAWAEGRRMPLADAFALTRSLAGSLRDGSAVVSGG